MDALERLQKIDRTQEINSAGIELYFWSRSPHALASFAGIVIALALAAAWLVRGQETSHRKPVQHDLASELKKPQPDLGKVILAMPHTDAWNFEEESATAALEKSHLDHSGKMVAAAYWESLRSSSEEANAELLYYAHYIHPLRFANELVGDFFAEAKRLDKAADYYRREVQFFDAR